MTSTETRDAGPNRSGASVDYDLVVLGAGSAAFAAAIRATDAGAFLIATGATAWTPPIPGLADSGYLTSTTALELKDVPGRLAVIGANAIGLKLAAQTFDRDVARLSCCAA